MLPLSASRRPPAFFLDAFETAYAAELPVHLEYRIQLAGGEPRTVRLVTYWNYNGKGQPVFAGVLRDLSEEVAKDEQLQEADEKWQSFAGLNLQL